MGFKYNSKNVICPIFIGVVNTTDNQVIGIECESFAENLGFDIVPVLRMDSENDLSDYTRMYCKDCYGECFYYKYHCRTCEAREKREKKGRQQDSIRSFWKP